MDPARRTRPEAERFWEKVEKPTRLGCWEWRAARDRDGYGRFWPSGAPPSTMMAAHRYAYVALFGPIPDGLQIDHLCRNPGCVNPLHLEAVTRAENLRRGISGAKVRGAQQRAKTHCPQGHVYDKGNTYTHRAKRRCIECNRVHAREYQRRKAATRGAR